MVEETVPSVYFLKFSSLDFSCLWQATHWLKSLISGTETIFLVSSPKVIAKWHEKYLEIPIRIKDRYSLKSTAYSHRHVFLLRNIFCFTVDSIMRLIIHIKPFTKYVNCVIMNISIFSFAPFILYQYLNFSLSFSHFPFFYVCVHVSVCAWAHMCLGAQSAYSLGWCCKHPPFLFDFAHSQCSLASMPWGPLTPSEDKIRSKSWCPHNIGFCQFQFKFFPLHVRHLTIFPGLTCLLNNKEFNF